MKGLIKVNSKGKTVRVSAKVWDAVLHEESGIYWAVAELPKSVPWKDAIAAANITCARMQMRAPTRVEQMVLVDDTRYSPAIDTTYFPNAKSDRYWTSTPAAYAPERAAWGVFFFSGDALWGSHHFDGFVRACCASQS